MCFFVFFFQIFRPYRIGASPIDEKDDACATAQDPTGTGPHIGGLEQTQGKHPHRTHAIIAARHCFREELGGTPGRRSPSTTPSTTSGPSSTAASTTSRPSSPTILVVHLIDLGIHLMVPRNRHPEASGGKGHVQRIQYTRGSSPMSSCLLVEYHAWVNYESLLDKCIMGFVID
jgi:hypothetical protein